MSGSQSQLPDDNAAGELIAVCWAWTSVSLIFVILRMYSRVHVAHKIWWEYVVNLIYLNPTVNADTP